MKSNFLLEKRLGGETHTHPHLCLNKKAFAIGNYSAQGNKHLPCTQLCDYSTKTVTRDLVILHKHCKEQSTHVISE